MPVSALPGMRTARGSAEHAGRLPPCADRQGGSFAESVCPPAELKRRRARAPTARARGCSGALDRRRPRDGRAGRGRGPTGSPERRRGPLLRALVPHYGGARRPGAMQSPRAFRQGSSVAESVCWCQSCSGAEPVCLPPGLNVRKPDVSRDAVWCSSFLRRSHVVCRSLQPAVDGSRMAG